MKRLMAVLLVCVLLCGCAPKEQVFEKSFFCMDTVMDAQIWGIDASAAASKFGKLMTALESEWDAASDDSAIFALNEGRPEDLTVQQQDFVARVQELAALTGGAFDPQLYAASCAWGFPTDQFRVPTQKELDEALAKKRWDLGAAVKGYAGQRTEELFSEMDLDRALLDLGGNILTYGEKPDGSDWRIGIRSPFNSGTVGTLSISGTMHIVTSGDYQRYFEQDGQRYYHILDPKTGRPADSGLSSVTVICRDGLVADVLSTALFVLGLEEGSQLWRGWEDTPFEAVFVLHSGEVFATEGARLSDCDFQVICREE